MSGDFDYNVKKKNQRKYIKFSFLVLLICGIIALIWGIYSAQHESIILQYGDETVGLVIEKLYGKTSKKSSTPSYYIRYECFIDSTRYQLLTSISKTGYDTINVGQEYVVRYLPDKNPIYNSKILFNKPIRANY